MDWDASRARLVEHLGHSIEDERVLEAVARVPRHRFVPLSSGHQAYEDIPLPIGEGQTISQPVIVAMMTQALELRGDETVLELGTGSGYQTAVLAELAARVVTVERFRSLADSARNLLRDLGYANIEVHEALDTLGWPYAAPYEGIIVTAAAPEVPQELVDQLADGGRLVIPVGSRRDQDLLKVVKEGDAQVTTNLGPCRFVPLIGAGAWNE